MTTTRRFTHNEAPAVLDAIYNLNKKQAIEAECATCGAQVMVPGDEDPSDTLCVACAEEEAGY